MILYIAYRIGKEKKTQYIYIYINVQLSIQFNIIINHHTSHTVKRTKQRFVCVCVSILYFIKVYYIIFVIKKKEVKVQIKRPKLSFIYLELIKLM